MFSLASTQARSRSAISGVTVPKPTRSSTPSGLVENFRMVRVEPLKAIGAMTALTRDPSSSRASTIGEDSSIRRPIRETMRSITPRSCSSDRNLTGERVSLPFCST